MPETSAEPKVFNLLNRTKLFARQARAFAKKIPFSRVTSSDVEQFIRSTGSIGANYIEAQEACSRNDFRYRIRICRKEAKESLYWLDVMKDNIPHQLEFEREKLAKEADELIRIFVTIAKSLEKSSN